MTTHILVAILQKATYKENNVKYEVEAETVNLEPAQFYQAETSDRDNRTMTKHLLVAN